MIAIDETGDKILLGRGKKYPGNFYSALAGFIEPGESFEDAVAREMWEEAGVNVWDITYHSGQPWPYPANLMVGFYARADSTQPIRIDLDNELVDARWFSRAEILAVLGGAEEVAKGRRSQQESPHLSPLYEGKSSAGNEPAFKVPGMTAIAGVLIRDWVEGIIGFSTEDKSSLQKNNL